MEAAGFRQAINVVGGYDAWTAAGFPTAAGNAAHF
jgi:rhodanese-related sulfurtransferase